ncbi:winged helix-turn-helix transcriptional regulator [Arthrobacter sp. CAU 1506]|uniref:IclR family transcriptional regulator n=1 Tax=Arthrobacter sp. CAU 1506 TaxID=2560052 RepID=UPI0010AC5000|nr:helix-turn-helix domain-containing protein [Arthrobacter sp. CAU 1506]TJY72280.1 winged helix-turn-helix transcriptional regulator [Arthrobacter sp. CAU 1506]
MVPKASADPTTRAADRALALLRIVCENDGVKLADAAKAVDLSASTALRLLRTLEANGFAAKRGNALYRPGFRMVQLGVQALSHESLVDASRDVLRALVDRTGESAYLSVTAGSEHGLYVAIEEGTHTVRHVNWVGRTFPIAGSAAGAALSGQVDRGTFTVMADSVEADVTAVAAPVFAGDKVVAALSIVAPSYRTTPEAAEKFGLLLAEQAGALFTEPETTS